MSLPSKPSPRPLVPVAFDELMESLADDEMVNIFNKALTSGFIEGQSLTLRFHGVPADVVQMFVYWIFHGTIPWGEKSPEGGMLKTHEELQTLLARLWMFGEEHLLPTLQYRAIWGLEEMLTYRFPAVELLLEVYEGTASDSPLRGLMANEAASRWIDQRRPFPNEDPPAYSRKDLDRMGAIPGFTADFAMALERQVVQAHLSDDERDACLWRLRGA
ncbi:hypothetical protein KC351_g13760 [Hortaea werneckii]|nr:hypothetical protein KC351_g13760 [Hortaea werneckii]